MHLNGRHFPHNFNWTIIWKPAAEYRSTMRYVHFFLLLVFLLLFWILFFIYYLYYFVCVFSFLCCCWWNGFPLVTWQKTRKMICFHSIPFSIFKYWISWIGTESFDSKCFHDMTIVRQICTQYVFKIFVLHFRCTLNTSYAV